MSAQRKTKRAAAPAIAARCVVCGHPLYGSQAVRSNVCGGGTECVCSAFARKMQAESTRREVSEMAKQYQTPARSTIGKPTLPKPAAPAPKPVTPPPPKKRR